LSLYELLMVVFAALSFVVNLIGLLRK